MRIAVAGGTGTTGRRVVDHVRDAGHEAVVLSRSAGIDLTAHSTALDDALTGAAAVIDASNVTTLSRSASERFFGAVTRTLLDAESRLGVGHHVALSIVGSDRVDTGYYAGKRLQEKLIRESDVPWTVVRATQFHEFTDQTLAMTRGPIAVVPVMRSQPIAVDEVAAFLVEVAAAGPRRAVVEIAGPAPESQVGLARQVLRARGSRRLVLPVRLPGSAGRGMASGALLPTGDVRRGEQDFASWLAETA